MIVGVDASGEELQGKVCPFSSIVTLLVFQNLGLKLKFATIFGRWIVRVKCFVELHILSFLVDLKS